MHILAGEDVIGGTCYSIVNRRFAVSNSLVTVDWFPRHSFYKGWQFYVGGGYAKDIDKTHLIFYTTSEMPLPMGQKLQVSYYNICYWS